MKYRLAGGSTNGSAPYADTDTGVAVGLMPNRFSPGSEAITGLDAIVADAYPPPTTPRKGARNDHAPH